ncbi:Uncharacterised protein [Mycobacterium tuberculosis]|nr:Uncharacterised protein [Mycobacterium tuberculosis]
MSFTGMPPSSLRHTLWAASMTRGTFATAGISFFSSSARNRSSWFGSAAAGPSCRIAAPISTTKAAPRAPAWLAMPVNMMGFPFC